MKLLHPLLVLPLIVLVSSTPCNFPSIFNLGDSNSDTGAYSAAFDPVTPPYGETFFGMPAGRFSDGRLIIDFIAESFGLPYLSSYLDSLGTNFSHGANFATASSTIIDQNVPLSQGGCPLSLGVQLKEFLQFTSRSQLVYSRGGVFKDLMPKEEYFSQALYTMDIGQNDLNACCFHNKCEVGLIPNAMMVFSKAIKNIYEKGGRNFWIHNTGPIGCLPFALLLVKLNAEELDSAGCVIRCNKLAHKFNMILNETVVELRRELPLASFTYIDIYSVKYLLISQAQKYGFEQPLAACYGNGGGAYKVDFTMKFGATGNVNGSKVLLGKPCQDPSKRISWDGIHYTEAANRWVFDQISGGKFSDPPNSLNMACHKLDNDLNGSRSFM